MTPTIGYGIIGCGMMGQEHLRNIALLPQAHVAAIFEPDAGMRDRAAELAPNAALVDTMQDLLDRDDVDVLLIVSPNHLHLPQLEQIAKSRHRPILVEKPLFTDVDDLNRVRAFERDYTAPVWVAMEYRYMPPIAHFLSQIGDVTGGVKMLSIREHRFPFLEKVGDWNRHNAKSGGTFVEKCCHFFDLMRFTLGSNPVRIMCSGGQAVNHLDEVYDGIPSDIWDHGYVIVDFENGARAMLELCMFAEGSAYQEELSATGPVGKIESFVPGPTRFWPADMGPAPVPHIVVSPRTGKGLSKTEIPVDPTLLAAGDHNGSTFYQHQKFLEMVLNGGTQPEVSLDDGIWAVRMGQAAQLSATTGQAVILDGQANLQVAS